MYRKIKVFPLKPNLNNMNLIDPNKKLHAKLINNISVINTKLITCGVIWKYNSTIIRHIKHNPYLIQTCLWLYLIKSTIPLMAPKEWTEIWIICGDLPYLLSIESHLNLSLNSIVDFGFESKK